MKTIQVTTPCPLSHVTLSLFLFSDQARPDQVSLFLTESLVLKGMAHPNIYPLLGACSDEEGPPMVMYPYTHEGNMKKFLQKCRMSECGSRYVSGAQERAMLGSVQFISVQFKMTSKHPGKPMRSIPFLRSFHIIAFNKVLMLCRQCLV